MCPPHHQPPLHHPCHQQAHQSQGQCHLKQEVTLHEDTHPETEVEMVGEEEAEGLQMVMTTHQVGHPMNNPLMRTKEKEMMKVIPQLPAPDEGDLQAQPVPVDKAHIKWKTPTEGQTKVMTGINLHWDIENWGGGSKRSTSVPSGTDHYGTFCYRIWQGIANAICQVIDREPPVSTRLSTSPSHPE